MIDLVLHRLGNEGSLGLIRGHSPNGIKILANIVYKPLGKLAAKKRAPDWRALFGIVDTCLTVYDIQTCLQLVFHQDTKGAALLAVSEAARRVVVATKAKKLLAFAWAGSLSSTGPLVPKFSPIALADVPVCMCCVGDTVIVGYQKAYVLIEVTTPPKVRMPSFATGMSAGSPRSSCHACTMKRKGR